MVIQNKFKIKRQAKNVFPSDVERTVGLLDVTKNKRMTSYNVENAI